MAKKVAITLILVLFVALLAAIVYYLYDIGVFDSPEAPQETSSQSSQGGIVDFKPPETLPDMQEAINFYETVNEDTVGWLTVPGTDIADPILQTVNNDYYLRLDEYREKSEWGCYFADYECSIGTREELSDNTIIYGHSDLVVQPDGLKFSQLYRFADEEFAKNNPVIQFASLEELLVFEIFSVMYTDTSFNYIAVGSTPEDFQVLLTTALDNSIYDYGIPVTVEDKIITLSTCDFEKGADARFVVMGRLISADAQTPEQVQLTAK